MYTDISEKHPVARLMLIGEVVCSDEWRYLPSTMGTLRMKRKQIVFSEMTSMFALLNAFLCANIGKKPLKVFAAADASSIRCFSNRTGSYTARAGGRHRDNLDGSKLPDNLGNGLQFQFLLLKGSTHH